MSASALPPEARSADHSVSATPQLTPQQPKPEPSPAPPNRSPPLSRSRKCSSANHTARGQSISLARRAAAVAKKKREHARAQFERQGLGTGIDNVLRNYVSANASTRPNVSQNKSRRHKRIKWTEGEVQALRSGVQKHGEGRWAVILRENADRFHPVRISVDLKDKWRNLSKSNKISMPRPAPNAPTQSAPPPIAAAAPPSTSSLRPSARSTIASWSEPASTPVQSSQLHHKPAFRALPGIAASHQLHQQSPQANFISPKVSLPHVANQTPDVSSTRLVPRPHRSDNLPQFHYPSVSRALPDPFDGLQTSGASAVNINTSSQLGSHSATEPKVAALVNPQSVSALVRRSQDENHFTRHQDALRPTHARTSISVDVGIRQSHRPTGVMHHTPSSNSIPPARSQPYASVAQLYTPGSVVTTGSQQVVPGPVSRSYGIHHNGSTRAPKPSATPFSPSVVHHQPATQPLESETHHFRPVHEAKEPASDPHQTGQSLAHHEESNHGLGSRFRPYGPAVQRNLPRRDSNASRPLRLKPEVLPTHSGQEDSHSENPSKLRERDDVTSARIHSQNIIGQSDDNSMHHLRPIHSDNRFGQEPREELNTHIRVTAPEDRFVPDQHESGEELPHRRSSHSGSRFDRDDDEDVQDDLEHSSGNIHLGIDGQQQELVRTGEGEDIHNEDSMRHVEVPREVLDNDEEDPTEDDIDRRPHTDPNHPNLFHGSDDEDDDQLAPPHPFGLVNHEDPNDDVPRVDSQQQPVNALGLTDGQQENAMGLHVRIIEDTSSGDYGTDRNRDQISSTAEPDHEEDRPHFGSLARNESGKGSQCSDTVENDSHRNLVAKRKERVATNEYQHHSKDIQTGQTVVRSIGGARFGRHSQSDNCSSAHGSEQRSRDVGPAGRTVSALVGGSVNHVRHIIGGVSQLSSDARDGELNDESQDFSACAMQSNDSDLGPQKSQLGAEAHLDEAGEANESQRMMDGRAVSITTRPGSARSYGFIQRSHRDSRLFGRVHNAAGDMAEVSEELSPHSRDLSGNASGSDTSREIIPLVNPASTFQVTRIKSSVPGRDKPSNGSCYAFDRDQALGHSIYSGVGIGRVSDATEGRGVGGHQRYGDEGKEESEGRHRVEDVASVANLLNPDCLDQSTYANAHKRSHAMGVRRRGETEEGSRRNVIGRDEGPVKRAKTGNGG